MYFCLCNALKEHQLDEALENGATTVEQAFRHLECAPMCGQCVPYVRECVEEDCCRQPEARGIQPSSYSPAAG